MNPDPFHYLSMNSGSAPLMSVMSFTTVEPMRHRYLLLVGNLSWQRRYTLDRTSRHQHTQTHTHVDFTHAWPFQLSPSFPRHTLWTFRPSVYLLLWKTKISAPHHTELLILASSSNPSFLCFFITSLKHRCRLTGDLLNRFHTDVRSSISNSQRFALYTRCACRCAFGIPFCAFWFCKCNEYKSSASNLSELNSVCLIKIC